MLSGVSSGGTIRRMRREFSTAAALIVVVMALGAVAALKSAGLSKKVKVVGFDGSPDAVSAIKAGTMDATVLQPAAQIAKTAVDEADKYIKTGKTGQPEKQSIDCTLITKANAAKVGVFSLSQ